MAISSNPWMGSVTGGTGNTPQNLQTLLLALASTIAPLQVGGTPLTACSIQIQADTAGGGAKFYIGNRSGMTATDCGVQLVAGQVWQPPSLESNYYRLDQIWLMSDTSSVKWIITFITR